MISDGVAATPLKGGAKRLDKAVEKGGAKRLDKAVEKVARSA